MGVLIEGSQQETQPEQVLFTEVQVLVAEALVDEGAYTQRRVSLKPHTQSETYLG